MSAILETPRLRLREFQQEDLDDLTAMVADEDQMRFYPRPKTRAEASAWITRNLGLYEEPGFGFWFIESIATAQFLGYSGIRPLALEGASEIEIGWHTKKTSWNQGIASEAAIATRDLAFRQFALFRLVAVVHPDHLASRRVAENIGMHVEKTTILDDYPCVIYAIERPWIHRTSVSQRRENDRGAGSKAQHSPSTEGATTQRAGVKDLLPRCGEK
jgi:RimJ/RimL family protein N-acetyltransferase